MITKSTVGPHVCLRCQRSLAKRRPLYFHQVAFQSTGWKGPRPIPSRNLRNGNDEPLQRRGSMAREAASPGPKTDEGPTGRMYGHRGFAKIEKVEDLRDTTLGAPAKVIVLRDSIFNFYTHKAPRKIHKAEHIDIMSQLDHERGLPGPREVKKNIDSFRPKGDEGLQSWEDINELVLQLQQGFTILQLERYIKDFEGKLDPELPEPTLVLNKKREHIRRITPWQPGVSDIDEYFDNDPLRGYILESHTDKQRVILRLLRECWMLELPELEEGIGQFEIETRKDKLELLLLGHNPALRSLSHRYLDLEGEKLEVYRSRGAIRFTTVHSKKEILIQATKDLLKGIRKETIYLGALAPPLPKKRLAWWTASTFTSTMIDQLGRLTDTVPVRFSQNLLISSVDDAHNILNSKIDLARRLLLTSVRFLDHVDHQLARKSISAKGAFVEYPATDELPWQDKLRRWARWIAPTAKESPKAKPPIKEVVDSDFDSAPSFHSPSTQYNTCEDQNIKQDWATSRPFTETCAIFGNVLHHFPNGFPVENNVKTLGHEDVVHTFVARVPNLSRLLRDAQPMNIAKPGEKNYVERIVMRFLPNPFFIKTREGESSEQVGAAAISAFPPIEMIFEVDNTSVGRLKTIQAVVNESRSDVMLPDSAVDIRFRRRTAIHFTKRQLNHIQNFLAKSTLTLGPDLETPPSITIPISRDICRKPAFNVFNHSESTTNEPSAEEEQTKEVRDVEYLFAGLEIHRTVPFLVNNWLLLYTSIEGGKAGGRRAELRLRPMENGKAVEESKFIRKAYSLASMISSFNQEDPPAATSEGQTIVRRVKTSSDTFRKAVAKEETRSREFQYFSKRPPKMEEGQASDASTWEISESVESFEEIDEGSRDRHRFEDAGWDAGLEDVDGIEMDIADLALEKEERCEEAAEKVISEDPDPSAVVEDESSESKESREEGKPAEGNGSTDIDNRSS